MEKLEDIINFKLYTCSVEIFHYYESIDHTNYLKISVKQYLFEYVNLDYFEKFFDEIKGKTKEEFLEWLEEKAEEEGSDLRSFLEEAEVSLEPIEETFFNEETGDEVKGGFVYLSEQNEFEFGLAKSLNNEEYFFSLDEANKQKRRDTPESQAPSTQQQKEEEYEKAEIMKRKNKMAREKYDDFEKYIIKDEISRLTLLNNRFIENEEYEEAEIMKRKINNLQEKINKL
jgi:hypothetical protein